MTLSLIFYLIVLSEKAWWVHSPIICLFWNEQEAIKSFSQELSTLNHSNHKKLRGNEQFLHQRTQKLGSSSREVPFKSPSHLAVNIDDPPRHSDQLGSQISISSRNLSDEDKSVFGFFSKK